MTLANDVAGPSGVVNLTSADVKLDTEVRDCSFKHSDTAGWVGQVSSGRYKDRYRTRRDLRCSINQAPYDFKMDWFSIKYTYIYSVLYIRFRNRTLNQYHNWRISHFFRH